jgi:hypothetical protein
MPNQLSLFPSGLSGKPERTTDSDGFDRVTGFTAIDEVFEAGQAGRSLQGFRELLTFISRFHRYSPLNSFLLYLQKPLATLVATTGVWEKKFNRRIKADGRPLILLAPMSPVVFVFDVADTQGDPIQAAYLKDRDARGRFSAKVYENTLKNSTLHGVAVREVPPSEPSAGSSMQLSGSVREVHRDLDLAATARYLILIDSSLAIEGRYSVLVHELARIFCGHLGIDANAWWADRRGIGADSEKLEARSAAYLVCARRGLKAESERWTAEWGGSKPEFPRVSLNTLLQAVGYIEEMGQSAWQNPKRKSRYKTR